ncbi:hypothetical protein FXO38_22874 [Capsicum annuum]|nr:hypothetical protein FXO38_22874 [Capsicum annuum]KAF3666612.1 hypothetical protein FXO37_10442 [Capsicum annuum]
MYPYSLHENQRSSWTELHYISLLSPLHAYNKRKEKADILVLTLSEDVDLYTLWAEAMVTEDNLILDVLFLIFYEFSPCTGELWKKMCSLYEGFISNSYNFGKLAVSAEAVASIYHAKLQLLLILIETLDLENLLQMVHDEIPFRQGYDTFSLSEVQEIDAIVSSFDVLENKESGPLILAWAVFLCLISSLPEKEENNILMVCCAHICVIDLLVLYQEAVSFDITLDVLMLSQEIDHIGYVRQAFEAGSLTSFLEIIENDILRDFDGPVAGFRSVLRTFIAAFIASYEVNLQLEDGNLKLILDILCKIYEGEESLCTQFWDRESFVDGPIRCLLCSLEGEFPFRTAELTQLLSALCEGAWPAECVFNFLDKSTGLSSPVDVDLCSIVDDASQTVMVLQPLHLPGIEGLVIPSGTHGHLLKMIDTNIALVRWEPPDFDDDSRRISRRILRMIAVISFLPSDDDNIYSCRSFSFPMMTSNFILDVGSTLPVARGSTLPIPTMADQNLPTSGNFHIDSTKFSQSGVFMLLLRFAQGGLYLEKTSEITMTLGLLNRLVTFNMGVCSAFLDLRGYMHDEMSSPTEHLPYVYSVNVAETICACIKSLPANCSGVASMSMGVNILAKMLKCSPYLVSKLIVQANIFDVAFRMNPFKIGSKGLSSLMSFTSSRSFSNSRKIKLILTFDLVLLFGCFSGSWLLSGRLAKMLSTDLLDLTMQFMDSGMENDVVLALVIFSIQYVLVNHEFWNYKIKHARWKVTLKDLELADVCRPLDNDFLLPFDV